MGVISCMGTSFFFSMNVRDAVMYSLVCLHFRSADEVAGLEAMNVDQCFASLNKKRDCSVTYPTCVSSVSSLAWVSVMNGKAML